MSENLRKDINEYTQCMGRGFVLRPNSMRRVSAVKELERLRAKLKESEDFIEGLLNRLEIVEERDSK